MLVCWLAAGCAGVALNDEAPVGFDLGGKWKLDPSSSEVAPEPRRLRERGITIGMISQDFPVLRCRAMEIEQSADSMGISYDGADYRDVSWGVRQRGLWEVNAGWEDGQLRILSKAPDARAEETMTLEDGGTRLVVRVRIRADAHDLDVTRAFTRGP